MQEPTATMEQVERKILELVEIQLKLIENLYKDVQHHLDTHTTSSNNLKVIKNVPLLKMNLNSSRQKAVVQLKAQIKQHRAIIEKKYGSKQ